MSLHSVELKGLLNAEDCESVRYRTLKSSAKRSLLSGIIALQITESRMPCFVSLAIKWGSFETTFLDNRASIPFK
jgi:hypothetical protein